MPRFFTFVGIILLLFGAGCQKKSRLELSFKEKAGVENEVRRLMSLQGLNPVSAKWVSDRYLLSFKNKLEPKTEIRLRGALQEIIDIQEPKNPVSFQIKILEKDPGILEMLGLEKDGLYPLAPDPIRGDFNLKIISERGVQYQFCAFDIPLRQPVPELNYMTKVHLQPNRKVTKKGEKKLEEMGKDMSGVILVAGHRVLASDAGFQDLADRIVFHSRNELSLVYSRAELNQAPAPETDAASKTEIEDCAKTIMSDSGSEAFAVLIFPGLVKELESYEITESMF